jgi:hypothetical protein
MHTLLLDTAQRAADYLEYLDERAVVPTPAALASLTHFDQPPPGRSLDPAAVLAFLDEFGSPATVVSAGGRYFGFVTGGSLPASLAAILRLTGGVR